MATKKRVPEQAQEAARAVLAAPMVKPEVSELVLAKRTSVTSPNFVTMYANGFQIAVGPLDVRLFVVETVPVTPTEVVDKQIASIIMTPETFKLLANNIGIFVNAYEDKFGKIRDLPIQQGSIQSISAPVQK